MTTPSIILKLVEAASLLTFGAVLFGLLHDRLRAGWRRDVAVGISLGISALSSMAEPLPWADGFYLDARASAIILAGPFGGPTAIAIVVGLCSALRLALGGSGVSLGLLGIALAGLAGLAWWRHLVRRERALGFGDLHAISLTGAASVGLCMLAAGAVDHPFAVTASAGAAMMAITFVGTELLGALLLWGGQRHRALADLAAREAQLRAIADNLPGAIYERRLSAEGEVGFRFVSGGVKDMLGVAAERALADPDLLVGMISPEDRPRFDTALRRSAQELTPFSFEGAVTHTDGRRVMVRSYATPRRGKAGEILWDGIMLDATEEVRLVAATEESRANADRTAEAKTRFLAYVTHEFRSPLSAIIGYCELAGLSPLLARRPGATPNLDQTRLADYLQTIRMGAEHLSAMTEDLLDLGKTEAGRLAVAPCWLDLSDAVEQTLALVRPQAELRHVAIEAAITPGYHVFADPRRLRQILLNLMSNAVKYSYPHTSVTIRAERQADADMIEVADIGIGMNADQLAVALDAYGQVDNGTNRMVAGTGLGLPLVKQLVELHDGTMSLSSAEGKGTLVTVRLPHPPGVSVERPLDAAA